MKKYMCICLLIVNCVVVLLFASCGNKKDESNMNNIFFNEYVMDDTKAI